MPPVRRAHDDLRRDHHRHRPGRAGAGRRLAGAGMKVAIVERGRFGGTCVNTGCMPTKTLVASAYAAHLARRAADYGVSAGDDHGRHEARQGAQGRGRRRVDARRRAVAAQPGELHGLSRPRALRVGARGRGRRRASCRRRRSSSTSAAAPRCPTCPASTRSTYLTNSSMMDVDFLPRHLVVVGGSYIGLEFGQMYPPLRQRGHDRRDGAAPDRARGRGRLRGDRGILEPRGHRRPHSTPSASASREATASDRRCERRLRRRARPRSRARTCCSRSAGGPTPTISASTAPASKPDKRGYIAVDDELRTNVPGIWALGDCNGTRRLHPHLLQRLRDRRRQPARRRAAARQRPHPRLCALHRPAARPRRHDRGGGPQERPPRAGRQARR